MGKSVVVLWYHHPDGQGGVVRKRKEKEEKESPCMHVKVCMWKSEDNVRNQFTPNGF